MPHIPGHGRPGFSPPASIPSPAFSPQDMNIPEAPAPSQNFGSNVVIGGNPGDAGGSTFNLPSGGSSEEADKFIDRILGGKTREKTLATNILTGTDDKSDDGQKDDGQKDDETFIQKIQGVLTGDEIKQLNPAQLAEAQRLIGLYQPLNLNPFQLRSVMIKNLFEGGLGKDQTYTDMKGNRVDPDDVVFRLTDDGQQMFFIDEDGKEQPVRYSREGILDLLGSDTIQSLERFAPDLIFGTDIGVMPATSGSLLTVANNPVAQAVRDATGQITGYVTADGRPISKEQGEKYNESIFAARAELDRMGKNTTTGTSNQGIMAASPALPGLPVVPPVTPPGTTPPAQPPIPAPVPSTGIMPQPFNIQRFYASLPQYTQSGVMAPTNLSRFTDALKMFPGATV